MPLTDDNAARQETGTKAKLLKLGRKSRKPGNGGSPTVRRISTTVLSFLSARCTQLRNPGPQSIVNLPR
jgi:hypothetical protein